MKKTLCFVLAVIIIIGSTVFAVGAISVDKVIDNPEFKIYEENGNTIYSFIDEDGNKRTYFYLFTAKNPNGTEFTMLLNYRGATYLGDALQYYVLGDYVLRSSEMYSPGYYFIVTDNSLFEICEAYKLGLFDIDTMIDNLTQTDDIYGYWDKSRSIFLLGDANQDNIVTVSDVTEIQKYLAGTSKSIRNKFLANVDGDKKITINDATAIQRKIAKFSDAYGNS